MVETAADYLDYQIGMGGYNALLLSPHGVVFAATNKNWLFRLAYELAPEDLETVRNLRQFGPAIPGSEAPSFLPFDLGKKVIALDNAAEAQIYSRLVQLVQGRGGALVSVAHRDSVTEFHTARWLLSPQQGIREAGPLGRC